MPSRSFPEKRPQEISRLKRRAEAARGARALSAFEAEALAAFGENSREVVGIARRERCWWKLVFRGPMTARSPIVYCAATEVGNINTDDAIAKPECSATGTMTACPGCDSSLDAGYLA
jgi:hypothetical protein